MTPKPQACESCGQSHEVTNCTEAHPICAACCAEFQSFQGMTEAEALAEGFASAPPTR